MKTLLSAIQGVFIGSMVALHHVGKLSTKELILALGASIIVFALIDYKLSHKEG